MTTREDEMVERVRDLLTRSTPGPWRIGTLSGEKLTHVVDMGRPPTAPFAALNEGAPASAGFTGFPHSAVVHSDGDRCEIEADAELIALVPEMAKALAALSSERDLLVEALTDLLDYALVHDSSLSDASPLIVRCRAALTGVTGG